MLGLFIGEKVWLEYIFEPNIFPYKYPIILYPSHSSHLPACEDGRDSALKRRRIKFRPRGITQKKARNMQNRAKVWSPKRNLQVIIVYLFYLWNNLF